MKIVLVAGARPNFMKIAPIIKALKKLNSTGKQIPWKLVHTGQHYDNTMSKIFFDELDIPEPDIYLEVGSASHAVQTATIMIAFEKVCLIEEPDTIVVVGDVNSTIACSMVAAKLGIKIAHVEAGLRSYDRTMPEEINRVLTDAISDYLFTSCEDANDNLEKEGIDKNKIFFVGNVMIDTLLAFKKKSEQSVIMQQLGLENSSGKHRDFALLTLHRPGNVDNRENFVTLIKALKRASEKLPIIFPVHPRTRKQIETFNMGEYFNFCSDAMENPNGIICVEPLSYLDFLHLMTHAKLIFTDSGGIQEETTILGVPCITLRENTERPVTITEGTNELAGTDPEKIDKYTADILRGTWKQCRTPKLWDGKAAERIINILKANAGNIENSMKNRGTI